MKTWVTVTKIGAVGVFAFCIPIARISDALVDVITVLSVSVVTISADTFVGTLDIYTVSVRIACSGALLTFINVCDDRREHISMQFSLLLTFHSTGAPICSVESSSR